MANYQAFEQQYPTLNKFVGAAREAAAVMPGANLMTPGRPEWAGGNAQQQQSYNDARQRFQQESPYSAAAGQGLGYGIDMLAASAGLGALGKVTAGNEAVAAAEAAMAGGGNAARGNTFSALAGQAAREQAPRYLMPTLSNTLKAMPQAAALAAPAAKAALGAGAAAMNYAPMVAPVAAPMLGAVMGARGNSPQATDPSGAPSSKQFTGSAGAYKTAPVHQATLEQALHRPAPAQRSSEPTTYMNTPMFPGDDVTRPLGERMMALKMSPRPHYTAARDSAINLTIALAKERFNVEMQRAQGDPEKEQLAKDRLIQATGNLGGAGGVFGQMGFANTPQADDGSWW